MADQQQSPVQPQASSSQQPSQTTRSHDQQQAQPQGQAHGQPETQTQAQTETAVKQEPDANNPHLDVPIEQEDIDMNNGENTAGANANGEGLGNPLEDAVPTSVDALAAAAAPSKKETSLREFLGKMDEYAPIIPDAVTAHYLTLAGLPPPGHGSNQTPPHLARLLSLAAQKFIADIAADSYQYARIRASNSSSASNPMGSLNAASGLVPGATGAGAAGGGAGVSGESGKGKAGTHLGIQRPGFGGGGSGGSGQGRTVLTMEDLGMAVGEYGVSVKRGEFYR